ncbi:PHD and RING finger domain-containing protein 1 isoform X2 [Tenrec ecaudatus]|uniref:PHD and RING finger domain-containing protein 1 isoform X2 n=1 Tax=Tenrec ecaudatus TaxID=94439 RepID=UPI003F5A81BA
MDDDSLDELAERVTGPGRRLRQRPAILASDVEESSDGNSGDSDDDTGSEQLGGTEEEEEEGTSEDLEDRSGSGDEDAEAWVADTQKRLDPDGALSSDSEGESCPICLNAFRDQAVGTPETCAHYFCLDCILEWSKNANSCPVDRTVFQCICVRAQFGGKILRKIPTENTKAAPEAEEEDPTFCEVCGRSDREDRLLLCDGCDAGYHMECLDPPLQEVPVDEWFCPECAAPSTSSDPGHISEEEVSLLLADVVPTSSRLRPTTSRTRAIARTRQSERVRATVNRNRITTAQRAQHVPRYLMSSLLEETIEAVASGLSTAVYQRPLTPRAPMRRRRKTGRRKKVLGRKKAPARSSARSRSSGARARRRQGRLKRRQGRRLKVRHEVTTHARLARTLGLRKPLFGTSLPSVHKPADPSLGLMRADIGAAPLSLFGDPHQLDPFDSDELATSPASPLSAKRRVLSQSALRSHQPVARPVSMALSRRGAPAAAAAPEPPVEAAPVPDLLGSILCGQSLLMMSGQDVVIHRDGSLSAKRAAPAVFPRHSLSRPGGPTDCRPDGPQSAARPEGGLAGHGPPSLAFPPSRSWPSPAPSTGPTPRVPAHTLGPALRLTSSGAPQARPSQALASGGAPARPGMPVPAASSTPPKISSRGVSSPPGRPGLGRSLKPAPGRRDISELPRIPKIKQVGSSGNAGSGSLPSGGPSVEIPSSCISRLTGREGPAQPGRGPRVEPEPSRQGPREPQPSDPSSQGSPAPAPVGSARGKGMGSAFESFRINIPGNVAHSSRHPSPGFCNTFRPVDNKVQRKENPAPLFSLKKPKQLKSEIYDPFNPTGSDSSSPSSSPERPGAGLLPSEITRTISIHNPTAPSGQTVRCVTSYTVHAAFRPESDSPQDAAASDLEPEAPGAPRRSAFFDSEARTVTCVTVVAPDAPLSPDALPPTTHRVVELRSPSPARPDADAEAATKEPQRTGSRSRSGSRSRERSSRSASPPAGHTRKQRPKARARRSSSEGSSSRERARRKRVKGRERERGSWGHGRRRSRSGSAGSSSHEHHEGRRKRPRSSASRSRVRDGSPASSLERVHRHKRRRERSRDRTERKEGASRPRGRRRSRERSKWRARSPSADHRAREQRRPRSRERLPGTHSCSPDRKPPAKEETPPPVPNAPASDEGPLSRPPGPVQVEVTAEASTASPELPVAKLAEAPSEALQGPEGLSEDVLDDLDYGDAVEAGHIFEDFTEAVFQLDDMSSPPSPESSDSSPERTLPLLAPAPTPTPTPTPLTPTRPCQPGLDPSRALAVIQREVSLIHGDEDPHPPPSTEGPHGQEATAGSPAVGVLPNRREVGLWAAEGDKPEEAAPPMPLMRSKAPVKRVTWNLREETSGTPAADQVPREPCRPLPSSGVPAHRLQQPKEVPWGAEGAGPVAAAFCQVPPFSEPLPPGQPLPEPVFPDIDVSQVYSPTLPVALPLPSSGLPYAPVSQPAIQFHTQSSLPLAGCGGAQGLAPVPTTLTNASEPAVPVPAINNSEEKGTAPKSAGEKVKNEEYLKKLHMQERAVEEVKLAIKPFYQKREITKEEYKDILRKAVQKICHSKSGEINPLKVANLVRAYVDKYRHMRRHKKAGPEEGLPAQEVEG